MRGSDVISGSTILVWGHPAARVAGEWIAPSYEPSSQAYDPTWPDRPDYAPWFPQDRFAPVGPDYASLPPWRVVMPLHVEMLAFQPAAELPEALLDEPAVLDRIADLVAVEEPGTVLEQADEARAADSPYDALDDAALEDEAAPSDWRPPEPSAGIDQLPAAYWATTTDPVRNAELGERHAHPAEPQNEPGPAGTVPPAAKALPDAAPPGPLLVESLPPGPLPPGPLQPGPLQPGPLPVQPLAEVAEAARQDVVSPALELPEPLHEPVVALPPAETAVPGAHPVEHAPASAPETAEPPPPGAVTDDAADSPTVQWDTHPERLVPPPPSDDGPANETLEQPAQPAAYWAKANWAQPTDAASDQPESLAWTPPSDAPAGATARRRTTPAMEGLWATAGMDAEDGPAPSQPWTARRVMRRAAPYAAGLGILVAACIAALLFLPRVFVANLLPAATFNAPMMVLRAAAPGQVTSLAVQNGQTVAPDTLLLTIRTQPQADPAADLLRDRLTAAQAHLADLDQALGQPTPTTDAGRARIADLRRQRATAATDVAQLQDGVTHIPLQRAADLPVKAGVHGVIRSLEAHNGATITTGTPLVRMLDCDHAFLTLSPDTHLQPGEAVQVRLPNLPAVPATVRKSVGIAEPPDSLVIATAPGAFVGMLSGSCPVGATATVTPSITGS